MARNTVYSTKYGFYDSTRSPFASYAAYMAAKPELWGGAMQGSTADRQQYLKDAQEWEGMGAKFYSGEMAEAAKTPQQKAAESIKKALDDAKAANEKRYDQGLGIMDQRIKAGQGAFDQTRADTNQNYNSAWGRVQQQMVGRGLGSSSIMPTMAMGVERDRSAALNRVNADAARYGNELLNDKAQWIYNRNDIGPSYSDYLRLMEGAGYGSGSGGVSYGGSVYGSGGGGSTSRQRPWSPNWQMDTNGLSPNAARIAAGGKADYGFGTPYGGLSVQKKTTKAPVYKQIGSNNTYSYGNGQYYDIQ